MMHVHSFAYDYHLRCVHSYISGKEDLGKEARLVSGYHLTNFLDDFIKYYSKGPNYARNLVYSEIISIENLITSPRQLYDYLLSHDKHYHMSTFAMNPELQIGFGSNEYVLGQVTSSPSFSYKDAQDRQHTDDLDITLIVSYLDQNDSPDLILKYYLILTSHREVYPKPEVERTLGKFRTVSSSNQYGDPQQVNKVQQQATERSPVTDSDINTSYAQEMIEDALRVGTSQIEGIVASESDTDSDTIDKGFDNFHLNEIFPEFSSTDSNPQLLGKERTSLHLEIR